jgi:hypothetical protein
VGVCPTEQATKVRVSREVNTLSEKGGQEPYLTSSELARVDKVLKWARKHDSCLTYAVLGSIPRLMEFVYEPAGHVAVELRKVLIKVPVNPSPPAANTRGATSRKDTAQDADKGQTKRVDKGKGKGILIEPEKPEKVSTPSKLVAPPPERIQPKMLIRARLKEWTRARVRAF